MQCYASMRSLAQSGDGKQVPCTLLHSDKTTVGMGLKPRHLRRGRGSLGPGLGPSSAPGLTPASSRSACLALLESAMALKGLTDQQPEPAKENSGSGGLPGPVFERKGGGERAGIGDSSSHPLARWQSVFRAVASPRPCTAHRDDDHHSSALAHAPLAGFPGLRLTPPLHLLLPQCPSPDQSPPPPNPHPKTLWDQIRDGAGRGWCRLGRRRLLSALDDVTVSLGKTVDCIVISEGGHKLHNYSIYYLSLKDSIYNMAAGETEDRNSEEKQRNRERERDGGQEL
ncbi:hypothetical protein JZ751_003424 [Albula glossodonta]|uniref:Uncharacterized protein n=1 Tax=Albula glossodonta TaxID=121402 RepID=A0A8T2N6C6_9TELE|nr:hypothetical protein JZ751_003424 [Albula glossodonta]